MPIFFRLNLKPILNLKKKNSYKLEKEKKPLGFCSLPDQKSTAVKYRKNSH